MMNRYIRQETLSEIGGEGQEMIGNSSVAIIGVGAIGSCTSELLVRAGVGKILLVDKDKVDLTNLQRQVLFDEKDIGRKKVVAAKKKLEKINSEVKIFVVDDFLSEDNSNILSGYDLILDCTDNMQARFVINDYCEKKKKLWVYSAAVGTKGNVLVVGDYRKFRDAFKSAESFDSCESLGIVNSVSVIASSIQATEALKILTKKKYCRHLIRFDAWNNEFEKIKF